MTPSFASPARSWRALASLVVASLAVASSGAAGGCDPLHPQAFFAAPWNDDDSCLEKNAAVDVYDDETAPDCTRPAACAAGPEDDGRLYVTTCPLPEGWTVVDSADDPRCGQAIDAFRSGDDGRCS